MSGAAEAAACLRLWSATVLLVIADAEIVFERIGKLRWRRMLESGDYGSSAHLARAEKIGRA